MRLKSLNISSRSETYDSLQEDVLKEMSKNINKVGEIFDVYSSLENFIIENIDTELIELIKIRDRRKEIEKEEGHNQYLNKFTKEAKKINNMLSGIIEEWDAINHDAYTIDKIKESINSFKKLSKLFIEIEKIISNFSTIKLFRELIDEFGGFIIIKVVVTDDITNRINNLLKARDRLINMDEKEIKDQQVSIDDL